MPVHLEDRQLAKRLRRGDRRAFDRFFQDYFARLYRFAQARLPDDRDATAEVVQTSLTKAMRHIRKYRGEAALFTWLCSICRNEIADWHRRHARYRTHVVLSEDHPEVRAAVESLHAPDEAGPQQTQQRSEAARLIQVALDRLPPRYGDALEWKYIEGRSVKEIAGRLAISADAAQSLLARARRAFQDIYAELVGPAFGTGEKTKQAHS